MYSLLKMTQMILSSMDSDEVNSINDTVESLQVVDAIEQCYNDIISTIDFPENWNLFELEPSLDPNKPTLMHIPEDVVKVEWIRYDKIKLDGTDRLFRQVLPMERQTMLRRMNVLDTTDSRVFQFDYTNPSGESFDIRGYNNKHPDYYTTWDQNTVVFDSFDISVYSTLEGDKTECYGMRVPRFQRHDDWEPPLDLRQVTLLYNEAKSQCFLDLKQVQNNKAEQRARRGWVHSQRKKEKTKASAIRNHYPDYGRGRRK